ncbi:hypothetical protein [Algoriphagus sp.]|jgi:hypothetical protein|uniref:hypothetical protein n=1 Tax=Algoriphagus sp. TaxID=1872435 RepID=UPI0027270194|nr:hypothetical protein [Algoriphagus sp.]MDO8966550.1 hypothetical protein [Algoriphagus sp.]MDP3201996.1 hypothetical protein [Algoriphagus sp.]
MAQSDQVLTPELVKLLKIFIFLSLGLVLILSFFNSYRANNTGEDKSYRVNDSNRLYFMNVRAIHYDREVRRDAGMTLFRHGKRLQSDAQPTLDLVILLNPVKDDAYIYFELKNADWPIRLSAKTDKDVLVFDFSNGNNDEHFGLIQKLKPLIQANAEFELILDGKTFPIWSNEMEKEAVKSVVEDYFRLLN